MTTPICLSLPSDLLERIDAAAAADDRSRSAFVRRVLREALADDAALRREAEARFEDLQSDSASRLAGSASGSSAADAAMSPAAAVSPSVERRAADPSKEQ